MPSITSDLTKALLARPFPAKVAQVVDLLTLVINRGSDDNVKMGQRFLVYGIGEDVIDPDTQQSLGALEVVRGTGVVTHLQPKLAVLKSDQRHTPQRRVVRQQQPVAMFPTVETTYEEPVEVEFDRPGVGDFAKPV